MLATGLRFVFFGALVVANVLFFVQPERPTEARNLASPDSVQCWGASDQACGRVASVLAMEPGGQPAVRFTKLRETRSFGFSLPDTTPKRQR